MFGSILRVRVRQRHGIPRYDAAVAVVLIRRKIRANDLRRSVVSLRHVGEFGDQLLRRDRSLRRQRSRNARRVVQRVIVRFAPGEINRIGDIFLGGLAVHPADMLIAVRRRLSKTGAVAGDKA